MSILRHIKRLQFIDFLIKKRATGDLETFARKNRLSKRGLTDVIQQMREMGFPIKYDRSGNTYYYEEEGEMVKCLFIKKGEVLSREEVAQIISKDDHDLCFSKTAIFELCEKE